MLVFLYSPKLHRALPLFITMIIIIANIMSILYSINITMIIISSKLLQQLPGDKTKQLKQTKIENNASPKKCIKTN